MSLFGVKITGTGSYSPKKVLTNADLEKIVDTNDEWIVTRTGIKERHIAEDNELTSDMATHAAKAALESAGRTGEDIDLIILGTLTPDRRFPNTGTLVQKNIGAVKAASFSMEAGCTGFLYCLHTAAAFIESGFYKRILVIGAEKLSSVVNWEDRTTCVLFGDAAGAVVVEAVPEEENTYLSGFIQADGNYQDILYIPAGGCQLPINKNLEDPNLQYVHMTGKEVFKIAVNSMSSACEKVLENSGLTHDDIDWVIPHQANLRIIHAVGKKLQIEPEKIYVNVDRYGNTSAASVPLAMDEMVRSGKIQRGQKILLTAFGGGLTWGATVIQF